MTDKSRKEPYKSADEVLRSVREYSDDLIQTGLADIHKRVENVVKYKQINEEQDLHNPVYYSVNNIRQMHSSTTADYFKFNQSQELGLKATIIGRISTMNVELRSLEIEEDKDE